MIAEPTVHIKRFIAMKNADANATASGYSGSSASSSGMPMNPVFPNAVAAVQMRTRGSDCFLRVIR